MISQPEGAVEAVAALYGVETARVDVDGHRRTAPPDVVIEVLARLGAPVSGAADLADAAGLRRRSIWERVCPPVRVSAPGEPANVPLRLPADRAHGRLRWHLAVERGGPPRSGEPRIEALGLAGGSTVDGRQFEIRRLELPPDLPAGRHRLVLRHGGDEFRCRVIVAPPTAYTDGSLAGTWGLFHPLFGLRSTSVDAVHGAGDLGTLRDALRWTARRGGALFGTTPLLAGRPEPPVDASPYAPLSRLFWDDRCLALGAVPGFEDARAAGVLPEPAELARHAGAELVPWDELTALRDRVLSILAARFFVAGGDRERSFRRFLAARPDVAEFARFMAARSVHGADWRQWPEPARSGAPPVEDLGTDRIRRHLFGQWAAAMQFGRLTAGDPGSAGKAGSGGGAGGAGAGLYLDVPLGVHPTGYDVWRHPDLFVDGVAAGAPPDDFFRGGQDWGLPPLHPERIRDDGYAHVEAVLRHSMSPARLVRIDHVMQFHRLYWVPEGASPADGVYVRYPAEEMAAVVALASHRCACEVVGEDLGTVPDAVRELMDRKGIRRTQVLGFSLDELAGTGLPEVPSGAAVTIGTHDMVPLAGLREGVDLRERAAAGHLAADVHEERHVSRAEVFHRLDERFGAGDRARDAGGGGPDPLLEPWLGALGRSRAGLVIVSLDDLFGVREPQNVPGTLTERPNWRRRLPSALNGGPGPAAERALEALDAARREARAASSGTSAAAAPAAPSTAAPTPGEDP